MTEFKASNVNSIDCGGTLNSWSEVGLQLMDGYANDPMSLGKFGAIARKSMGAVEGLADPEIYVEFAPQNQSLTRHVISNLREKDGKLIVELGSDRAACKPMVRASSGCCGPTQQRQVSCR